MCTKTRIHLTKTNSKMRSWPSQFHHKLYPFQTLQVKEVRYQKVFPGPEEFSGHPCGNVRSWLKISSHLFCDKYDCYMGKWGSSSPYECLSLLHICMVPESLCMEGPYFLTNLPMYASQNLAMQNKHMHVGTNSRK